MRKTINCATYDIKFNNKDIAGKKCLVFKAHSNDLHYVIPLTRYTDAKWEKYSEQACRLESTGSIALISKMKVKHKRYFVKRSMAANTDSPELLVPSPEDIELVLYKLNAYINTSKDEAMISYRSFFNQLQALDNACMDIDRLLTDRDFAGTIFEIYSVRGNRLNLKIDDKYAGLLTGKDIQWIISKHISRKFSVHHYNEYYLISFEI